MLEVPEFLSLCHLHISTFADPEPQTLGPWSPGTFERYTGESRRASARKQPMTCAVPARLAGCSALAILIAAVSLVGSAAAPARAATQPRERIAYVSVVEAKTLTPVREVGPDAIAIHEDGTRREVLSVTPASSPMPLALIVDNSEAAAAREAEAPALSPL